MAQGIFKSVTNRCKPKFNIGWLFNVAFSFTHLCFKEIVFFPLSAKTHGLRQQTTQLPQAEQVSTCESCTQEAKEAEVKLQPHLLSLQVTKITFPGLASTFQQQANCCEGLQRKKAELGAPASLIPISFQSWPSAEVLGKLAAPFSFSHILPELLTTLFRLSKQLLERA